QNHRTRVCAAAVGTCCARSCVTFLDELVDDIRVGQVGRERRQLVDGREAQPLQEVGRGPVEHGAALPRVLQLLDQPSGHQGAHDSVDVDTTDCADPCP